MFRRTKQGFTLVELMVVIVILGILATLVAVNVGGKDDEAKVGVAKANVRMIFNAVEHYKLRVQSYPEIEEYPETLEELMNGPSEWEDKWIPLLQGRYVPKDPWDNDYEIIIDEEYGVTIICYGKDKTEGGTGFGKDITYPAEEEGLD